MKISVTSALLGLWCLCLSPAEAKTPAEVAALVDQQLEAAWKQHKLQPTAPVDDAAFLRRVTLDLTGKLPTAADVEQFLASNDSHKRAAAVDRLLQSADYGNHWANYWDAILLGRLTREAFIDRAGFRQWLAEEFHKNRPWNEFVTELITAEGYNSHRHPQGAHDDPSDWDQRYHPATNWFLRYSRSLPDLSGAVTRHFLGLQIQCAQCHDHPTEMWKQADFEGFTAIFVKTWATNYDKINVVGTLRMDTKDRFVPPPVTGKYGEYFVTYAPYIDKSPRLLDGTAIGRFQNRRQTLAKWLTSETNPWFAKSLVNRMWQRLLGTGFVEPIDDFSPSNPAMLPEVLDLLADDFADSGFDVQRLVRIVCASRAYQLSCGQPQVASGEHPLWSAYPIKALDIETSYDIVVDATGGAEYLARTAKGNSALIRSAFVRQFVAEVGTDEMTEATDGGATIPKALMQFNGALMNGLTRKLPGLALEDVLKNNKSADDRITALYLRTLSRQPSAEELAAWKDYVRDRRVTAKSDGPPSRLPTGFAALKVSPEIANAKGGEMEFRQLLQQARTGADFKALAGKMKNNADAGLYVKALEAFAAQAPFEYLANQAGGTTAEDQAYEDVFWALISCSEFLTNH